MHLIPVFCADLSNISILAVFAAIHGPEFHCVNCVCRPIGKMKGFLKKISLKSVFFRFIGLFIATLQDNHLFSGGTPS